MYGCLRANHMAQLILWDIDGTLVRGSPAIVEAFDHALRTTYRVEGAIKRISYGGKTDPQIVLETLELHDHSREAALAALAAFCELYTREVEQRAPALTQQMRVLTGAREALQHLQALGARQTLLTGNLEPTARIKLDCTGLSTFVEFAAGAYGSDHHDRNCLVPIALEKARRHYGRDFDPRQVVVIGDTPRDIDCARAGGVRVIAVATGTFGLDALAQHQPDGLLPDLADLDALLDVLGRRA
jgi:phosphoglycolate phosphatase